MSPETYAEQLDRVRGMASGEPTWDLSDNDTAALRAVLARLDSVGAERDRLRAALVGLVGMSDRAELEQLEVVMRSMPAPAEDKAATIDAIHALLATGQ